MTNYIHPNDSFGFEIDFLPVGDKGDSGDAICMRWGYHLDDPFQRRQFVMVVDGGYQGNGRAIVNHLNDWYGTKHIDVLVNTHPDQDHISGMEEIFNEPGVVVDNLVMQRPWLFPALDLWFDDKRLTEESIRRTIRRELPAAVQLERTAILTGETEVFDAYQRHLFSRFGVSCWALSPSIEEYGALLPSFSFTPGEAKDIGDVRVEPKKGPWYLNRLQDDGATSASNESSLVLCLVLPIQGRNVVLLTGDAGQTALGNAVSYAERQGIDLPSQIRFFQVPHHGSAQNLGPTILDKLFGPGLDNIHCRSSRISAVASVSAESDSMHPSQQVVNELACHGICLAVTKGHTYNFQIGDLRVRPVLEWSPVEPVGPFDNLDETTDERTK